MAMKQVRGGFSNEIAALRQELIDFAALIELELDFGEEDVEFADRTKLRDLLHKIRLTIHRLLESFELGNVLKHGVSTIIAGRPNAGKSTLLNALLNEERAIVSDIAGTTRDTISEILHIKGMKFRFVDTAGIRDTADVIESLGVQRALDEISRGALVLYMADVTTTTPSVLREQLEMLNLDADRFIVLLNKMDLHPYLNASDYYFEGLTGPDNVLPMSAKNHMNVEALKEMLYHAVVKDTSVLDQTIVTNTRHVDALNRSDESLAAVLHGLDTGVTGDFIALDIRQALYHLASITGNISSEDLLDSIFTRFCIGK
jgi:tRNA modification GTPase